MEKYPSLEPQRRDAITEFIKLIRTAQKSFNQLKLDEATTTFIEQIGLDAYLEKNIRIIPVN